MTDLPHPDPVYSEAIGRLFASVSDDPNRAAERLRGLRQAFQTNLARCAEQLVKQILVAGPPESLDDFERNAMAANTLLRDLGLFIEIEGRPALLVGELHLKYSPESVRYALLVAHGRSHYRRADVFREPPHLHLAPATPESQQAIGRIERQLGTGPSR